MGRWEWGEAEILVIFNTKMIVSMFVCFSVIIYPPYIHVQVQSFGIPLLVFLRVGGQSAARVCCAPSSLRTAVGPALLRATVSGVSALVRTC